LQIICVTKQNRAKQVQNEKTTEPLADEINLIIKALTPPANNIRSTDMTTSKPGGTPEAVDAAMDRLVLRLLPDLQRHLDTLVGRDFGEVANAELAKSITRLLRRLGCCVECPKCHEPASAVRFGDVGSRGGSRLVWKYEHSATVRHGGTLIVGPLKLVSRNYG
jgi:hypothetical protein